MTRTRFADPDTARANLDRLGGISSDFVDQIAAVADPDGALASLVAISEHDDGPDVVAALQADPVLRERAMIVLGTSRAIGVSRSHTVTGWPRRAARRYSLNRAFSSGPGRARARCGSYG